MGADRLWNMMAAEDSEPSSDMRSVESMRGLSKADVEEKLQSLIMIEGARVVTSERYNSEGTLCYFEVSINSENGEKLAEYAYTMEGDFPGLASNDITRICVTYYRDGEIEYGEDLAHYYNGEWI